MEYLNVLHRLFHEDKGWLTTHYLPTKSYLNFFKKEYSNFYTHFSFVLTKQKLDTLSILEYTEIPFYNYQVSNTKEGYKDITIDQDLPEQYGFLVEKTGFNIKSIERIHLKEEEDKLLVELFIRESFENLSDIQLCYYYYQGQTERIDDNIKQHLHMLFFDEKRTEKQRTNIIRKYQTKLNYYITVLERKFEEQDITTFDVQEIGLQRTILDVYKCVCLRLEGTLMYMEECYGQYINRSLTISYLKRKSFIEEYFQKSKQLISLFKAQQLPQRIEKEVSKPPYAILDDNLNSITYTRLEYYRKYIDLFTRQLIKMETPDHNQVYKLLIELDYNAHNVYRGMVEEVSCRIDRIETLTDKQAFRFKLLYKIQSIPVTTAYKYKPDLSGLQEYLTLFIRKQIDLNQKQIELEELEFRKKSSPYADTVNVIDTKLGKRRVNLTVSEIALMSRLFKETGVICPKGNKQNYFKFLSKIYKSKDTEDISEKSIKNCFYTISPDTFETVERLLIRILSKLQMLRDSKALQ